MSSAQRYDFAAFDTYQDSTAPQRGVPQRRGRPSPGPRLLKEPRKSRKQLRQEAREQRRFIFRIVAIAAVFFCLIGATLQMRVQITALVNAQEKAQVELEAKKSEHIRLMMELNSKVSLEKVEEIASTKLGMVKCQEPLRYITIAQGDEILFFSGKE